MDSNSTSYIPAFQYYKHWFVYYDQGYSTYSRVVDSYFFIGATAVLHTVKLNDML